MAEVASVKQAGSQVQTTARVAESSRADMAGEPPDPAP